MILSQLRGAFALLTRLPVGHPVLEPTRAVWAYPVVGLAVGGIGAGALLLAQTLRLPRPLAAAWTLVVLVLVTGALHEDGLADTADGFGGGRTVTRKLEIMRDSRIGSFGALALLLSLGIRGTAIAQTSPVALIVAGGLARAAMIVPLLLLRPARADGLAAPLRALHPRIAISGLAIGALAATMLLPWRPAVLAIGLAGFTGLLMTELARRQIGGYTGDVLGATALFTECVVLTALAAQ